MGTNRLRAVFLWSSNLTNEYIGNGIQIGLCLPEGDLISLTGYKRPGDQRRWLGKHGWAFEVRADGKNRVLAEEARNRMLTGTSSQRSGQGSSEPDLAALRNLG